MSIVDVGIDIKRYILYGGIQRVCPISTSI